MRFPADVEERIASILAAPLVSTLRTRTVTEPWDEARERFLRPLHFALVPEAVWKGSKFERSFTTSLGNVWERAAIETSRGVRRWMQQGCVYEGEIHSSQMQVITHILGDLEARRARPDWDAEIAEVFGAASGDKEPCRVTVDVAVGDSAGDRSGHEYYEIKSPKPNADQTKVSKEKMLKLTAMEKRECAFYALPFNPWGTREAYDHPFPKRYFDMASDRVVLIGVEFWERLGGQGTWDALLEIAETVGERYRSDVERYLLD
jgi:hypothetical protein